MGQMGCYTHTHQPGDLRRFKQTLPQCRPDAPTPGRTIHPQVACGAAALDNRGGETVGIADQPTTFNGDELDARRAGGGSEGGGHPFGARPCRRARKQRVEVVIRLKPPKHPSDSAATHTGILDVP